jgi:rhodanese-related sulfurtransferase
MKIRFHLFCAPRVPILIALLFWPCVARAADLKPDEIFDFGQGALGSEVQHDFHLVNAGTSPLTINEVKTSCPCARIVAFPKSIAPGQTGVISIDTKLDQMGGKDVLVIAVTDGKPAPHIFAIKGEVLAAAPVNPDLLVEPQKLLGAAKSEAMYIDVRPNVAFDEAHIPSSMNVPLFALKARTYLKSRPLVIVGTGSDDRALVATVEACRKEGFSSIRIMRGGIRQWQQVGGRLEGVFWQQPPLGKITASQLLGSAEYSHWLVLLPRNPGGVMPADSHLKMEMSSYAEVAEIEGISASAFADQKKDFSGVVVFAATDADRETLNRLALKLQHPLFVVDEPWTSFTSLVSTRHLAMDRSTKTEASGPLTKRLMGCATCP